MVSLCYWYVFFFFKQKTAYEMRISDWSSDVCSSDLITEAEVAAARAYRSVQRPKVAASPGTRLGESRAWVVLLRKLRFLRKTVCAQAGMPCWHSFCRASPVTGSWRCCAGWRATTRRSEERRGGEGCGRKWRSRRSA